MTGGRARRLLVSLAAAMCLLLAGCGRPAVSAHRPSAHRFSGQLLARPVRLPDVPLVDTSGHRYVLADALHGHVALVYAGYTHCPDACPTTMANIAEVLRFLPPSARRAVRVVFITEDPARDTPAVIRTWLDRFDPHFVGLTGSAAATVVHDLGFPRPFPVAATDGGTYDLSHVPAVLAFERGGVARLAYSPDASLPAMAADVRALLHGVRPPPPAGTSPQINGSNVDFGAIQMLSAFVAAPSRKGAPARIAMTLVELSPAPDTLTALTTRAGAATLQRAGRLVPAPGLALAPNVPTVIGPLPLQAVLPRPPSDLRAGQQLQVTLTFAHAGRQTVSLPVVPSARLP